MSAYTRTHKIAFGLVWAVAPLTLVSLGAVNNGVTLYCLLKKIHDLFSSSKASSKLTFLFSHCYHSQPLSVFQLIVCPVFFINSAAKKLDFHQSVTPGWCHPGRSAPSASDATGSDGRQPLGAVHQVNQVNSRNDYVMLTARRTLVLLVSAWLIAPQSEKARWRCHVTATRTATRRAVSGSTRRSYVASPARSARARRSTTARRPAPTPEFSRTSPSAARSSNDWSKCCAVISDWTWWNYRATNISRMASLSPTSPSSSEVSRSSVTRLASITDRRATER